MNTKHISKMISFLSAKALCLSLVFSLEVEATETEKNIADFKDPAASKKRWITVNDNVMGGKSKGGPNFSEGKLSFSGSTNTDGGGFSSIRTRENQWDLSKCKGILMKIKGDGRVYTASITTDHLNRMSTKTAFRAPMELPKDQWKVIFVPFENYKPTFWGREIKKNPPAMNTSKISSVGFHIYDKKDGAFKLEVEWIKAVSEIPVTLK